MLPGQTQWVESQLSFLHFHKKGRGKPKKKNEAEGAQQLFFKERFSESVTQRSYISPFARFSQMATTGYDGNICLCSQWTDPHLKHRGWLLKTKGRNRHGGTPGILRYSLVTVLVCPFLLVLKPFFHQETLPCPGWWLSWLEHPPVHQNVAGSIPSPGTYRRQLINVSLTWMPLSLSLSPSPFLSKKSINISLGENLKKLLKEKETLPQPSPFLVVW